MNSGVIHQCMLTFINFLKRFEMICDLIHYDESRGLVNEKGLTNRSCNLTRGKSEEASAPIASKQVKKNHYFSKIVH